MTKPEVLYFRKQIVEIVALAVCDLPAEERLEQICSSVVAAVNAVIAKRPDATLDDMRLMLIEDQGRGPIGSEILVMLRGMAPAGGNMPGKA